MGFLHFPECISKLLLFLLSDRLKCLPLMITNERCWLQKYFISIEVNGKTQHFSLEFKKLFSTSNYSFHFWSEGECFRVGLGWPRDLLNEQTGTGRPERLRFWWSPKEKLGRSSGRLWRRTFGWPQGSSGKPLDDSGAVLGDTLLQCLVEVGYIAYDVANWGDGAHL